MDAGVTNPRTAKACFDGVLMASLAYGALLMLFIQLTQVLLTRPKRGRIFWGIVAYSALLLPLCSIAIGGKLKFAEMAYAINNSQTPQEFYEKNSGNFANMIGAVSTTLVPWVGDLLMLYRLMVVWNYDWKVIALPLPLYLTRIGLSIPLLLSDTKPGNKFWTSRAPEFGMIFYSLCLTLNTYITIMISLRLIRMRPKVEQVMGKLHAAFYTSSITIFVESGAFFTLWSLTYVISRAKNLWFQEVFLQPYSYIISITRMLIILRMAQDRAWTKDVVTASANGVLDWQVSSTNSIPLHEGSSVDSPMAKQIKSLPKKYREDTLSL